MKLTLILGIVLPIILTALVVWGLYFLYVVRFRTKKATPNQALLVTGKNLGEKDGDTTVVKNEKGNYVKIVRGGVVRLKFQQYAEKISLNSFQLSIGVDGTQVKGKDTVDAQAIVQISVGDSNEHVLAYAEQFLGKDDSVIHKEIEEIITTHFRAILTTLTVDEINANRESFNAQVLKIAKSDLDGLGFKISSFGLGRIVDTDKDGGYLSNAEKKRKAIMKKEAEIVQSEADRETRIKKAEDEQLAKDIENQRAIETAQSNKQRELQEAEIRKQTDKARAEAETVYELEKATQRKKIVSEENEVEKIRSEGQRKLALIKAEEEKEVAIKRAEQSVEEEEKLQQKLKVEADSKADIDKIKANAQAEVNVRKAKADAEVEIEIAEADARKKKLETEVEVERTSKIGIAEAESILAKGTSEAKSQELLALAKLVAGDLHLKELAIKTAPLIAKEIAEALSSIDSVKVFQTGGSEGENVSSSMTNAVLGNVGATYELLRETTGIDLSEIALNKSKKGQVVLNTTTNTTEIVERNEPLETNNSVDETIETNDDSQTSFEDFSTDEESGFKDDFQL